MSASRRLLRMIEHKKLGGEASFDDLVWLCRRYASGELPDYQIAAWLMAVRWRGMTPRETLWFTEALVASGQTLEWPGGRPMVDKHSTGGVGDKTTLVLVPLLASAGIRFVKMSGRGLGHTGGTLDKLEAIPGYRVDLSLSDVRSQLDRVGCAIIGQSSELVPADGALYALRDVTSTIDSIPLIASSVMSKKIAAGARAIILDVKYGSGALIPDRNEARALAEAMVAIGSGAGRRVRALLSPMDAPLGRAVGNALEVAEAVETLRGGGPPDLRELTCTLGAHLMMLSRAATSLEDAYSALGILLDSGVAADHFERLIAAQGGDPGIVADPSRLPQAAFRVTVRAPDAGWINHIHARCVADVVLALGGGRQKKGDVIDPSVGVRFLIDRGTKVARGDPIAEVHAASEAAARNATAKLTGCVRIGPEPTQTREDALEVIGA